ncbi:MAG: hypothetical protein AMXMBFR47_33640 [Planctomycetota bacterium]
MHRVLRSLIAGATSAASAFASVTTTVDLVDPSDGITQPPPGILAVDVLIDVSPDDTWTAAGIGAEVTSIGRNAGVSLRYAPDVEPNSPQPNYLINPGVENRFVTFLTRPRDRDSIERYEDAGAAIGGRYAGAGGPIASASAFDLNVGWFRNPPAMSTSPSVDGAIMRVALNVADLLVANPGATFAAGSVADAAGPIIFSSDLGEFGIPGTASVSFDNPTPRGLNWAVWYIPEPATLVIVLPAAAILRRRR